MEIKEIVAATNNKGKLKEIQEILKDFKILSLKDLNCDVEVEEDKNTFEGNSIKKARELSELLKKSCIADDSGLCIEEFKGWPGVKTARFLGEDASQTDRNNYILNKMKGLEKQKRKAKAVTVISIVDTEGKEIIARAEINGYISEAPRGDNGFGFDEIFELENGRTLAELSSEEKNEISSRRKALKLCLKKYKDEK